LLFILPQELLAQITFPIGFFQAALDGKRVVAGIEFSAHRPDPD
jgi:hypothetical protein